MPDDKKIIEPIDAAFDDVAKAMVAAPLANENNRLGTKNALAVAPPRPGHVAYPGLCLSIDVQNQEIVPATRSQTHRVNNIRAACRQIVRAWNSV